MKIAINSVFCIYCKGKLASTDRLHHEYCYSEFIKTQKTIISFEGVQFLSNEFKSILELCDYLEISTLQINEKLIDDATLSIGLRDFHINSIEILIQNKIKPIPNNFNNFSNLENLKIVYNSPYFDFPDSVFYCKEIKDINLIFSKKDVIITIPDEFIKINKLNTLILSGIFLKQIPSSIFSLTNLKKLNIHSNFLKLSELDKMKNLNLLETLSIGKIDFNDIERAIDILKNLQNLKNINFSCDKTLSHLNYSYSDSWDFKIQRPFFKDKKEYKHHEFPKIVISDISDFSNIKLPLHHNKDSYFSPISILINESINNVPSDFSIPSTINYLVLKGISLDKIPDFIFKLENLTYLKLEISQISLRDIEKFQKLRRLKEIKIGIVKISDIQIFLSKITTYFEHSYEEGDWNKLKVVFYVPKYPSNIPKNWIFSLSQT